MNASAPDPRFGSWLTEHAPRAADDLLDRTMVRVRAARQPRGLSVRWPALRFAAPLAAVIVVAVVGGLLLNLSTTPVGPLGTPGESPSAPSASATIVPSPEPSIEATPAPAAMFRAWTRIDLADPAPEIFSGATPTGVVAFRGGYVATGTALASCCGGTTSENWGVVWTSNDGRTWQLHNHLPSLAHASVDSLLTDGRSLYLLGRYAPTPGKVGSPTVWASTDGLAWTRSTGIAPTLAAAGPSGLVGAVSGLNHTFRFVRSTNGLDWTYTTATYQAYLSSMAVAPDGSAIALGSTQQMDDLLIASGDILAWRSPDGTSWTGPVTVAARGVPGAVTPTGDGFVAIVARSPSGFPGSRTEVWRLVGDAPPVVTALPLRSGRFRAVLAFGNTVILTGILLEGRTEATSYDATVWISTDGGATFGRGADQGGFGDYLNEVTAVAETSDGLLAVGQHGDGITVHPMPEVWIAVP